VLIFRSFVSDDFWLWGLSIDLLKRSTNLHFPGVRTKWKPFSARKPKGEIMRKLISVLAGILCCLFFGTATYAQGVGASGAIRGTVTDPNGAVLPNVAVTVTDAARGLKRTTTTDSAGGYEVAGLAPAPYDVSAEVGGFDTVIKKGVVVTVGENVPVDFEVKVSGVKSVVEVNATPPAVDTTQGQQANTIDEKLIRELPISRRDYLTYTLLAPAVADSTRLASNTDFRVRQTPQSGLSFYGSNGRGNSVTVDGSEANDDSGGVRLTLSQDAVQEFQINRSNYKADLGSASGASINIVSKTGTNDVHGSVYGFFRFKRLDSRDPFSYTQALAPGQVFNPAAADLAGVPIKDGLNRQQFGGTVGFPIKRDKTFMFLAVEGLRQNSQNAVPLLTNTNIFRPQNISRNNNGQAEILAALAALPGNPPVPCLTGQPAVPAATCVALLTSALTVSPTTGLSAGQIARNAYTISQFESNGGLFAYNTREYLASLRLDHTFTAKDQTYLRFSFGHLREQSPDLTSLIGFSRGSSIFDRDYTLQGAWFHQFSPRTQNELRLQWNDYIFNVIPNAPGQVGLDIPGFGNFGTNIFLPSLTTAFRPEAADNLTLIRGHHTIKLGGYELIRDNHTESHTFFPGRFVFGNLPGGLLSPCLQVPAACGLTGVTPATISPLQSVSLGLPQFYQQGFGDPNYSYSRPFTAFYGQDSWQVRSNLTLNFGVRYELDSQYGPINTDRNNFAPRVSFALDPFKDRKTVVRGGFGIFHSPVYGQITNVVTTLGLLNGVRQIAQVFVPLTGVPGFPPSLTSAAIFQTLFAQGRVQCSVPAAGSAACITPANLTQFGINITNTGPVPPLTVLFSAQPGYQNPYSMQGELGIEREIGGGFSVGLSYIYVHTLHLPIAIDRNLKPAPFVVSSNGTAIRQWGTGAGLPCAGANIVNCFVSPTILQDNVYSSAAGALYNGGILEVKKRFSHHLSLMASYTLSKALDDSTDFNSDYAPFDETNLRGERALSNFDQRHKIVIASVIESPWSGFLSGFQLSPIVRYNSGHPFNLLAGSDINGDRHSTNDRPAGAGRNTGLGPNYFDVDLRLARRIKLNERAALQLIAEGFNIFNRTNFGSVNNVVGNIAGPFNLRGTSSRSPSQSLGFTSALPKRQFQLGLRLTF
jgi:hypothetical protein